MTPGHLRVVKPVYESGGTSLGGAGIDGGGGPPHSPDMEARVTKLEAGLSDIKAVLSRIEPALGKMDDRLRALEGEVREAKGRISAMPSTWQLIGINLALAVAIAGLVFTIAKAMSSH